MRVDAGVSLDALMRTWCRSAASCPSRPGTRLVTVGGALAADVHGKNHHVDGSFANHVESFTLHTPKGTSSTVTPDVRPRAVLGHRRRAGPHRRGRRGDAAAAAGRDVADPRRQRAVPRPRHRDGAHDRGRRRLPLLGRRGSTASRTGAIARSLGALARRPRASSTTCRRSCGATRCASRPHALIGAPPWAPNGLLNRLSVAAFNEFWYRVTPRCTASSRRSRRSSTRSTACAAGTGSTAAAASCSTSTSCPTTRTTRCAARSRC